MLESELCMAKKSMKLLIKTILERNGEIKSVRTESSLDVSVLQQRLSSIKRVTDYGKTIEHNHFCYVTQIDHWLNQTTLLQKNSRSYKTIL